jgi:AcrR family transcriptional regulator
MPSAAEPPVDGRIRRSRDRVLGTAFELLGESGVVGFSVDEVSRRSGVAKTTIYRHWPSREALVLEACSGMGAELEIPDTGSVEADLAALLVTIGGLLVTARWSSVVPSLVDVAERDPDFADLHATIQRGHAAPLHDVLDRAVDRGDLPASTDRSFVISALMGPLYYRRWFARQPIDERFVTDLVSNVVCGLRDEIRRGV